MEQKLIAVPPVSWNNLDELLSGINAWINFQVSEANPQFCATINKVFEKYRMKTLEEISKQKNISISNLKELKETGFLNLDYKPQDILNYLSEITELIKTINFDGILVFLDELQITLSAYKYQKTFMKDLFEFSNGLLNRDGNYGIIFGIPTTTESLIADMRKDIIQRMQSCKIYIRTDSFVSRTFPSELWNQYAKLYEFENIKNNILPEITLDAIGQITSKGDLSAGPRTVIESFIQAINYYEETKCNYLPNNLIDDYLSKKIAFDAGGKLVEVINEALNIPYILDNKHMKHITAYANQF